MFSQISLRVVIMVLIVAATQVGGATLLTKTNGFREIGWTVACLATYAVSLFVLAETIRQGMALSLVMPILAALVPMATIAVAVVVLGESASWLRLGLLSGACVSIGIAASV